MISLITATLLLYEYRWTDLNNLISRPLCIGKFWSKIVFQPLSTQLTDTMHVSYFCAQRHIYEQFLCGARTYNGGLGGAPRGGPEAEPPVGGLEQSPLKLNAFYILRVHSFTGNGDTVRRMSDNGKSSLHFIAKTRF